MIKEDKCFLMLILWVQSEGTDNVFSIFTWNKESKSNALSKFGKNNITHKTCNSSLLLIMYEFVYRKFGRFLWSLVLICPPIMSIA